MPNHVYFSASSSSCSNSPSSSTFFFFFAFVWIPFLFPLSILSSLPSLVNAQNQSQSTIIMLPTEVESHLQSKSAFPASRRCSAPDPDLYFLPVIGIVSHPGDGASGRLNNASGVSFIASSYVKFVESAGARVIPLIYTDPPELLLRKLDLVNGVLFTGGWAKTGFYADVVRLIFKKVLEKNDAGQFFPCYAICLGFEHLIMSISKNDNILERFNASHMASTLQFVEGTNIEGTVFERFPPDLLGKLSMDCIVMQNHKYGISPETFRGNQLLSSFFTILTTSADEDDKVYVSTAQARHYPVTGFQWHPEKNSFEWGYSMIPHSEDAVRVTQNVANFLVSEARKSPNRPPTEQVLDNLIYNYSPTFCGKGGRGYDEVYIFTGLSQL